MSRREQEEAERRQLFLEMGFVRHHEEPLPEPDNPLRDQKIKAVSGFWETDPKESPLLKLQWHNDVRGSVGELYRQSWIVGMPPGGGQVNDMVRQVYISTTRPGVVKGWHVHAEQTDRFICVRGSVLLCTWFLEDRPGLLTVQERILSADRDMVSVHVPPGVVHGWKALGNEEAWVLNLCSREYDGMDEFRKSPHAQLVEGDNAYDWNRRVDG
jgi:dTDP-4-dehydrorhamnose 3,5-epimerase